MFDIIALVFLTRYIGKLAVQKGLQPLTWKIYTIVWWLVTGLAGGAAGYWLIQKDDLVALQLLAWVCSTGSFLIIRLVLQNKPDYTPDKDVNRISVDDLKP